MDMSKIMRKVRIGKRGQLDNYINVFVGAGLSLLFLTVIVIVIAAFQGTQTAPVINNSTGAIITPGAVGWTVLNNTLTMFSNLTAQFSTIGTVGGVLALLVILALVGVWGYGKVRGNM